MEIETPENLEHPIIQTRVKTPEGWRTVAPLGRWTDVIFSEEMYNAEQYGYKFTLKSGYIFDDEQIFEEYSNILYEIKSNTPKEDPIYLIAKLLLNSLYGRFGMSYEMDEHKIIHVSEIDGYLNKESIEVADKIELGDDVLLISFMEHNKYIYPTRSEPNVSIGISAAISGYARIFMSQFKNSKDYILYYSDTDSLYISGKIDDKFVGNGLGQFKLENEFKDIVFLAPKVYAGITLNDELVVKIKGLTKSIIQNDVTFDSLLPLLNQDESLVFKQIKSYKSLSEGAINLIEQTYSLVPTENKRELIYKDGVLTSTKAYVIDHKKEIFIKPLPLPPSLGREERGR